MDNPLRPILRIKNFGTKDINGPMPLQITLEDREVLQVSHNGTISINPKTTLAEAFVAMAQMAAALAQGAGLDRPIEINEATKLLIELDQTLRCVHLDMGNKHKYVVTHKSQPIIRRVKEYLYERSDQQSCQETGETQ